MTMRCDPDPTIAFAPATAAGASLSEVAEVEVAACSEAPEGSATSRPPSLRKNKCFQILGLTSSQEPSLRLHLETIQCQHYSEYGIKQFLLYKLFYNKQINYWKAFDRFEKFLKNFTFREIYSASFNHVSLYLIGKCQAFVIVEYLMMIICMRMKQRSHRRCDSLWMDKTYSDISQRGCIYKTWIHNLFMHSCVLVVNSNSINLL